MEYPSKHSCAMNKLNCISLKDRYSQAMTRLINLILYVVRHFGFSERPLIVKCYSVLINRSSSFQELVPISHYPSRNTIALLVAVAIKSWCRLPLPSHDTNLRRGARLTKKRAVRAVSPERDTATATTQVNREVDEDA